MARERTLREQALDSMGDFAGFATEDMIREKMAALYEQEGKKNGEDDTSIALHKAVIIRDGNLDAFEVKRKENPSSGWAGEDHAGMKRITKVMEDIKRDVGATGKKKTRTTTPERETDPHESVQIQKAPKKKKDALKIEVVSKKDLPKNGEVSKTAPDAGRRKRGRPQKHSENGAQFSVWLPDEIKKRLQIEAAAEGISAGELAARFIVAELGHK